MTDDTESVPQSQRDLLEMGRDQLVTAILQCRYQKDLPPLVRELRMILAELEGLPDAKVVTRTDEIAARREARRKAASE